MLSKFPRNTDKRHRHRASGCDTRSAMLWVASSFITAALVAAMSGCSYIMPHIFPSHPYSSFYVANRDGHYFAGDRCSPTLSTVGVFLEDEGSPTDFSHALWHALADPAIVREFELYSSDQPGVNVVFDDGTHPESTSVMIIVITDRGYEKGWRLTLDQLNVNMVFHEGQPTSWAAFWKMPNSDFGCR